MENNYGVIDFNDLLVSNYKDSIVLQIKKNFHITYSKKASLSISENPKDDNIDLSPMVKENNFNDLPKEDENCRFVYLIFKENCEIPVYVGKAADIKQRINSHMVHKYKGTSSKIHKVYECLDETLEVKFEIAVIKVTPSKFYSSIEGLLISYFGTVEDDNGWNDRDD